MDFDISERVYERHRGKGAASRCFRQFGLHSLCAVSDVQAWTLISVSEFTSGTVARVQRHAASVSSDFTHYAL
ncbi:hypothetical protein [Ruminococcus flavefaciens]|uniref:hypothetical protein n=1 Tax=Ruminococcus flavefaciens TaxID=1265 RepID=UPI003F0D46FF